MRKISVLIAIGFLLLCSSASAQNITLPWTNDFTASDSLLYWGVNGATGSRVAESWRGGGNYCAKLTPPTTGYEGVGTDGGYSALGRYIFTPTSTLNIAFAIKIGTTFDATAVAGSGIQDKFIDVTTAASTRAGILCLNKRANPHFVWSLWQLPTATNFYSDGSTTTGIDNWGASAGQITFYDGTGGTLDYAGRWLWVNYIITPTQQKIYVYDREGVRSGLYFQISSTPNGNADAFYMGGYYNHSHPAADANTYIMLDDLSVSTSSTPQSPPSGFVGTDTTPPTVTYASVNGSTVTVNFSETVVTTGYDAGDFNLDCTNPTLTDVSLTNPQGSGSTRTFTAATAIVYGQTCNLDYVGSANDIEDGSGNDMAAINNIAVTNNTAVPDTTAPAVTISTSSPQSISADSLSVSFTCTDAVGVISRKWRVGAAPTATLGTTATSPATTSGYSSGTNTLYVGCGDSAGNWGSASITVNRDYTPAFIDNISPSGVLSCTTPPNQTVIMSFTTNEIATALYGLTDAAYAELGLGPFGDSLVTSHTQSVSVPCGESRTYYIRTSDALGNLNTSSSTISFSVASPQIAGPGGLRITGGRLTH